MFLSNFDPAPPAFVFAKWVCIGATATTPLLLVVAAVKLSLGILLFAFAAMLVVPFMAVCGYGMSMLMRSMILTKQCESPKDFFPSNWSFPFRAFNRVTRLRNLQFLCSLELAFMNFFVVIWSIFLLGWVLGAVVMALLQP